MRLAALPILALAALAACAAPSGRQVVPGGREGAVYDGPVAARPALDVASRSAVPSVVEATATGQERAFVTSILSDLQRRSFAENREFCGYIGLSSSGAWVATPVSAGLEAACPLPNIPPGMRLVASFHTHGSYSPYYASEWPTTQDVLTDASTGIDGYIATPGGRLWHVDTDTMTVRELCGRGCLPQDPRYVASEDGPLRPTLTFRQLQAWERGFSF